MQFDFLKDSRYFHIESGLNLLQSGGPITMSWGVDSIKVIKEDNEPRAMSFEVNGMHFQGTVILPVNFLDYYEVRFMKNGTIIDEMTTKDLFVGNVTGVIDNFVEKIDSYAF